MGNSANDRNKTGTQAGSAKHGQQDPSQVRQQPSQQNQQAENKNNENSADSNKSGNKTSQQNTQGGGQH
jgi:hypothetical protein